MVIDALDEMDGQGGSEFLLDLFDIINKHRLPGLKFFVTSQSDPGLVTRVKSFEDSDKQFCRLEEVPMDEAQADMSHHDLFERQPSGLHQKDTDKLLLLILGSSLDPGSNTLRLNLKGL